MKMKKIFFLALGLIFITVTTSGATSTPAPKISVTPASLNLGSVALGAASAPEVVTIKNTGTSDLTISLVSITGTDSTEFGQTNSCGTITAGGTCPVNVTFTPALPYAKKSAILAITSNDPKKPILNVKLSGKVPPPKIAAIPGSLNFGKLPAGTVNSVKSVTVKNSGLSDLTISSIDIAGTDPGDFSATNHCGTVPKGESCTIDVTFAPLDTNIQMSATLYITSNDPKKPVLKVKLSGARGYGNGFVNVRYVGAAYEEGYFEVILNYNGDSDYHMGQLYGKALVTQYPTLEAGFADYFQNSSNFAVSYDEIMTRVEQIKNQIPQGQRDFISGLASQFHGGTTNNKDDHVLSVDEVFYFSLVPVINRTTQCSVTAVYNTASATGKPIIGRLLDWGSGNTTETVSYIKKGNKAIMKIGGSLLDQSISTGLNKHGIFVAILDSSILGTTFPDLSSDTYYAYTLDLRYALENYSTINDIANYLSQKKYTFNHLILLADSNTVKVLENDLEGTRTLRDANSVLNTGITWGFTDALGVVNAFLLKNNYDNFSANWFNTDRWLGITDQLNLYLPRITINDMKKITTYYGTSDISTPWLSTDGFIMNWETQQIIIYDSKTPELQVFFRNNRAIGTVNNTTSFDINNPEFLVIPVQF